MNSKINVVIWIILVVFPVNSACIHNNAGKFELSAQIHKTNTPDRVKFTYAELFYQRQYGTDKLWVDGRNVPEQLKKSISKTLNRYEALEIMGYEGWELVTAVTRNFDSGFEIMFYFRKQVN